MPNNKISKKKIGQIGESAAVVYLKNKGHTILGRNIRLKRGEIDILTRKDGNLHVVEVKTAVVSLGWHLGARAGQILPEENFSKQKINRLKHLANVILAKYSGKDGSAGIQIDGVAIRIYQTISQLRANTEKAQKVTARYYEAIS